MTSDFRNPGLTILNESQMDDTRPATIIVVGVARSGTSMVAGVLDKLGVFLGEKSGKAVFEDVEIAKAIREKDVKTLRAIIEKNDQAGEVWGFKRPEVFDVLPNYLAMFRNPRIVAIFRDPISIAKRNEISMHSDFIDELERAAKRTVALVSFVKHQKVPLMLVSYEKALFEPAGFLDTLTSFCGLTPDVQTKQAALAAIENGPALYIHSSRLRFDGCFESVEGGVARGWVRTMPRNAACNVEIRAGDRLLGAGVSDQERADIAKPNHNRAFAIPVSGLIAGEDVVAKIAGKNFFLPKAADFHVDGSRAEPGVAARR